MVDSLQRSDFEPLVGQTFQARHGHGETGELTLVEVVDHSAKRATNPTLGTRDPFSLVFEGSVSCSVIGEDFEFEHEAIGKATLHVLPLGEDRQEVHFN